MKQIIINLIKTYLKFVLIFMLGKPFFMLYHLSLYKDINIGEWFKVMWHGLPMDFSMSAYLMMIPLLLRALSVWINGDWFKVVYTIYLLIITFCISTIFVVDLELYSYWGFRLDSTPLFYLKNPGSALASVSAWQIIFVPVVIICIWTLLYKFLRINKKERYLGFSIVERGRDCFVFILFMGILFLPLRGGIKVSTMNIGRAYFSDVLQLNHAAINPMFSFFSSFSGDKDFGSQYRFMDNEKAEKLFGELNYNTNADSILAVYDTIGYKTDTIYIDQKNTKRRGANSANTTKNFKIERTPIIENLSSKPLLRTDKPNIIFIVLESFSAKAVEPLGGISGVTPNLNKLFNEGIAFTNFYANSFRTDRGLVSILSGYPAQPSTSIMKYPSKVQNLPSISASLKRNGYKDLQFIYGGDVNFTNMKGYFLSSGIEKIVADKDFSISQRMTKWGVRDDLTFAYLTDIINEEEKKRNDSSNTETQAPFFKMFLTLSSHEPFDVPTTGFDAPYLNSVAYTDSCLGQFIDEFKKTKLWDNTLIVLVPDHSFIYPSNMNNAEPDRYHIPMVWAGGAVNGPIKVDTYGSQIDIAATLLNEMNIDASDFKFSKNLRSNLFNKFAYYSFKGGFGILNDSSASVFNLDSQEPFDLQTISIDKNRYEKYINIQNADLVEKGKAFLQILYDDLDAK